MTLEHHGLERSRHRRFCRTTWFTALCLFIQLGQAANMAFVTDRCAEHGAGSHVDEHQPRPTRGTIALLDGPSLQETDITETHEAEHCPLCQGQREKAVTTASAEVAASSLVLGAGTRVWASTNSRQSLYSLAPKTSPPAA